MTGLGPVALRRKMVASISRAEAAGRLVWARRALLLSLASAPLVAVGGVALAQSEGPLLPGGAARVRFPFELLANAIFIRASVNGGPPRLFALDTGSSNSIIASELASELGIKAGATFRSSGAGSDSNLAASVQTLDFVLPGGVTRSVGGGAAISMAGLWPLIGERIYGVIGYNVLRPFVVEIDYAGRQITLHDPAAYRYAGSGTILPARMYGSYDPQIEGEMVVPGHAPIAVRFTLDTGAGGAIVASPLVDKNHLLEAVGRAVSTQDKGVGGSVPTEVLARLSAFRIGPYGLKGPVVALSRDKHGSLANEAISVNVGGNILRRFTVIIDYAGKRVILEPNRHFADRFEGDASGLLLAAKGEDFRSFFVESVIPDSPASEQGLRAGDAITALDGRPARAHALWELEDELKRPGTLVRLTLQRDGRTVSRVLKLRSLI
jgi:hypothetical protein